MPSGPKSMAWLDAAVKSMKAKAMGWYLELWRTVFGKNWCVIVSWI